ncbi:MAG: lasso peptide biosynthesis B2 protein [Acidobacteria bacterium]|nr:MAG: lasso peptide biosynthesis B2 protein [Acidobacteriota bacterium]
MLESLRRFRALEPAAQMLFLRAAVTLALVSLSLRLRGFRSTQTTLQKSLSHRLPQMDHDSAKKRVALTARMVNAADRHGLVHPSCLAKSLTFWWLLGRQGIASQLRIGIRKENDRLEAHAWVQRGDIALNEPEEHHHHYAAFDAGLASLPGEER